MSSPFPKDFLFGSATSSYQIEGAASEDGRKPSMWDHFSHHSGRIADKSTGDVACDHYHRVEEDIALMQSLNLNAYRFSIAWPRVVPDGVGAVNEKGLDFYDRLVDKLLAAGIAPFVTLYHWDLPLSLAERGGWMNRDTSAAFAAYAEVVVKRLGDRVHTYATLNEPRCSAIVGHLEGRHAPGEQDIRKALAAAHHLLLAHGLAMPALRAHTHTAKLGIVLDVKPYYAADARPESEAAAHHAYGIFNRWFADPLFLGHYPQDIWDGYGEAAPATLVQPGDMEIIRQPIDALGLNYYTRGHVTHDGSLPYPHAAQVQPADAAYTAMEWEVFPDGLYDIIMRIHQDYAPPAMYVAENGAAFHDEVSNGEIRDEGRQSYLEGHLAAVARARAQGTPLIGYLVWSLLDNFEWGWGYSRRFGIIHIDYETQQRTIKQSGLWYRDYIERCRRVA
ncbi:GH1 family beta-glucosidase [Propionivibrio soli]|uniref:GH1 family beta-glucosidase n=1 Tax=Propionivibrio soli TaxID=2976531 RepID=UPI0021E97AC7|nr:GH1 family beta-glucosidase [Propionivibrio soli]